MWFAQFALGLSVFVSIDHCIPIYDVSISCSMEVILHLYFYALNITTTSS